MPRCARLIVLLTAVAAPAMAAPPLPAPVTEDDYRPVRLELVELGRDLFFDKILSGNRNIACSTCHHPSLATSDGVSLDLGEGAEGLGPDRHLMEENRPEQFIPRNAPALFNLGARQFTHMFLDGRLEEDPERPSGLRTPLEDEMVMGFDSALAAQTMFPVLSQDEMAGHYGENDIAKAARQGLITGSGGAWDLLAGRVSAIPAYQTRFAAAIPEIASGRPLAFTDISNALAAFMEAEFRADDSPFDRHLRGEAELTGQARAGLELFYGKAGCATCHSGPFQTDQQFHAVAMPQLGPGKAARFERHQKDTGRARVTGQDADLYRFRTPSLRNVAETAPYGHAGAYADLRDTVRHMADPATALAAYDPAMARLPAFEAARPTWAVLEDSDEMARITAANEVRPVSLSETEIGQIVAFLESLTDASSLAGRLGIPETVPSDLPVDRLPDPAAAR
ncbi:cytochrome c peroxidase [Rhodobacteraceae bacterium DSL-40]|uniref:cytochrome-c peroxidase n=1 Tax=Amaricoccus sp. B4 TaxID=3368557 RepID=UPI000DADFC31